MPDIAQCQNNTCKRRNDCYRFMAIPSQWQSYMAFEYICKEENDYKWFWEINGKPVREVEVEKIETIDEIKVLNTNNTVEDNNIGH